jgi:GGDEF domain-containing protein
LRATIQVSRFRLRSAPERRTEPRGPDRRNPGRQRSSSKKAFLWKIPAAEGELSVTVSIGVAEANSKTHDAEQVMRLADKALYRAKHAGRNRVEAFRISRSRNPGGTGPSIAS